MSELNEFPWKQPHVIIQTQRILSSFQHWLGKPLLQLEGTPEALAEALFLAAFPVASHGTEADPIYNYGNEMALKVWELDWESFTKMPSRYSAEAVEQTERDRLLQTTQKQGFCHWQGVRISSQGKRFFVNDGLVWNLLDEHHQICGQAATYSNWKFL